MSQVSPQNRDHGPHASKGNIDKDKFDMLAVLRQNAWSDFDHRREFEWKVCLALWAIFAISIGHLVTAEITIKTNLLLWGAVVASLFAGLLHVLWIKLVIRANRINKRMANYLTEEMCKIANLEYPAKLQAEMELITKPAGRFVFASETFQIGITTILVLSTIILLFSIHKQSSIARDARLGRPGGRGASVSFARHHGREVSAHPSRWLRV